MNGATALLPPKTNNKPINNKIIIIGANQNFFRSFMKFHKSFKKSIFLIHFKFNYPLFFVFPVRLSLFVIYKIINY